MINIIQKNIADSIALKQALLTNEHLTNLALHVSQLIAESFNKGRRLYFCGNGGSAADAQHLAAEFTGPFYNRNRPAMPAEALHCNASYLTAAANDFDFSRVYARLVEGIMQPGDILIGLSTSGNSANVVAAFKAAKARNIITIGFTGESGGQIKDLSDHLFNMPSSNTPRIQEGHMLIGHIICELVEHILYPQ